MAEPGRPKLEKTRIKDQAEKLAMGYMITTVHEIRTDNNRLVSMNTDIIEVPGSPDALRLWNELCE